MDSHNEKHLLPKSSIYRILECGLITMAGIILIFGILYKSGALNSGYHLADDHELITIEHSIKNSNDTVLKILSDVIQNDLKSRFRPFYWVERVSLTALWGSNLYYWNIYKCLQGILTFVLLYFIPRNLKHSWHISFLFAAIIMFGTQFTPWFRSANQENTGLFLSAVTLFLISAQFNREKFHSLISNVAITITIILCGLVKESFTLMLPAFAAFKLLLEYCCISQASYGQVGIKACLKKNILFLSVTGISFLINIYIIVFMIGADKVSYAGFHKDTALFEYFYGIRDSLNVFLKWYYITAIILLLIIIVCFQLIYRKYARYYISFLILGSYIMGVQLLAHAKSLMWERYIIPFIIGYSLVFILLGYHIFKEDRFRRKIYEGVLLVLLILEAPQAYIMSRDYAYEGEMISSHLQTILDNTGEESIIIGAYRDPELNHATSSWLEINGRVREYTYDWTTKTLTDTVQMIQANTEEITWKECNAAICYSSDIDLVTGLMEPDCNSQPQVFQFSNYTVIIR